MKTPWHLSEATRLEQLAEEATELAHAALKLARIRRGENPTPTEKHEASRALLEEFADVLLCSACVGLRTDDKRVGEIYNRKLKRWCERLEKWEDEHA